MNYSETINWHFTKNIQNNEEYFFIIFFMNGYAQDGYTQYLSPDLFQALEKWWQIIEVRTGSDSDFPKIQPALDGLREANLPYVLRVLSAHRTPDHMSETAQSFPEIKVPKTIKSIMDLNNLRVKFCIAAAGGSAHIAGMTAAETQTPLIALPVPSSSSWLIDSSFSMVNMPPWIPNGFVPSNEVAVAMSKKLYHLQLKPDFNLVACWIPTHQLSSEDKELISTLWMEIDEDKNSPILVSPTGNFDNKKIQILSFGTGELENIDPLKALQFMQDDYQKKRVEWVYMWLHAGKLKLKNHILYAGQIIGMFNPKVRKKLDEYRQGLSEEVKRKDLDLLKQQFIAE